MEQKLHTDIATLGFGFHLSKSKWNQTRSTNSAVFRIREQEVEVRDASEHVTELGNISSTGINFL